MDASTALAALEAAGTEPTRRTFHRHGAPEPLFGVSFAMLRELGKRAGVDHALAGALWASGNTDARCLAMLVADPARLDVATADAWAAGTRYHVIVDLVAELVARSPLAPARMAAWIGSSDEYVARCGWAVLTRLALHEDGAADATFTPYLETIERTILGAPNRAREAMNSALVAIGGRSDRLAATAIAAARRIGPVSIEHGDTACKTVDAVPYIEKLRARAGKKRPASKKPRRASR